ncbi:MAG: UDP-N-acetylglucosamine 2-epimerase [Patescibacteria group bacterium]|nr:UDP-N-acetylglucosamine 2-epimerase [Patescibacteria group bacterium]
MKKKAKKIIGVLTGVRAEYGLLKPVMEQIVKSKNLRLATLVTGCHLDKNSGYTIKDIINDGFKVDAKIPMYGNSGPADLRIPLSLSRGLSGITKALKKIKPDFLLLLGDRGEALMGAIAAAYLNIPIAHIHGGDQCAGADIDDNLRHAITKLAHIHFPATKKSAQRIASLGEEGWRIHTVGAPGLDSILNRKLPSRAKVANLLNLDLNKPIILLLQHAVSSETEKAEKQMEETMRAIIELNFQTVIIYPNTDPGNLAIVKIIEKYKNNPFLRAKKSLPHDIFLGLMKIADVMVGNSSSAIVEAPSFKLPVVNIGIRQADRERSNNIIDVNHDSKEIKKAILKAVYDNKFKLKVKRGKSPYGDGKSAERIIDVLSKIKVDEKLLRKKFISRS